MFVGWLRKDYNLDTLKEHNPLLDAHLIDKTYHLFPELCFGVYDDEGKLVGVLSAYEFDEVLCINNFFVIEEFSEYKTRLIKILLSNVSYKTVIVLTDSTKEFENLGFEKYYKFFRYIHSGEAVSFNFTDKNSQELQRGDFFQVAMKIDKAVLGFERSEYIKEEMFMPTSFKLSTGFGFLHSYAINKKFVKISPWFMNLEAFLDAEKLMRGIINYRGLKKIYAFIPDITEITELYEGYKFRKDKSVVMLYLGEKPDIRLESVYAW
jgi:hypothetical protein